MNLKKFFSRIPIPIFLVALFTGMLLNIMDWPYGNVVITASYILIITFYFLRFLSKAEKKLLELTSFYGDKSSDTQNDFYVLFLQNWGSFYEKINNFTEAESKFLEGEVLAEELLKTSQYDQLLYAKDLKRIGVFYANKIPRDFDEAEKYLNRAYSIVSSIFYSDDQHPEILAIKQDLDMLRKNKDYISE